MPAAVADFYLYGALVTGALLSWRFQARRAFLALLIMLAADRGVAVAQSVGSSAMFDLLAVLLPLNLAMLALADDPVFSLESVGVPAALLAAQAGAVSVVSRSELAGAMEVVREPILPPQLLAWTHVPQVPFLVFLAAALLFLLRYLLRRQPQDGGFFWAVVAAFLAVRTMGNGRIATAYLATAGLVLAVSVVETSYRLAYHDELTRLPARRALQQALERLGDRYAIAVLDIDHFKSFNDEYGHHTGDQVLRMVASRIGQVRGGGEGFRYGGEEFVILFPESSLREAYPHAEELRKVIAASTFHVRGPDRSHRKRKERRSGTRARAGAPIGPRRTSVTVSIGLAATGTRVRQPDEVIRLADKALYRAKATGRNRVEVAGPSRAAGRTREQTPVGA
ncbi:MAG TPA: GGDEF domain-containing protein [Terriglobales bacterium]|nr:GGDEF domain-containing protein [Terriglobales bacterium]